MDSQRQDFSRLIASQFEYLNSNSEVCPKKLDQEFQRLEPQRARLHDFCESVVESLVLPRFRIVESQLGSRASFESVASDVVLRVIPSPERPSEAKFRLNYEIFIPAQSITFEYLYRIKGDACSTDIEINAKRNRESSESLCIKEVRYAIRC